MRYPSDQLDALVAVVDTGTFAAAARELGVTQSAVSQRIRALEKAAGRVVVVRATPCHATETGQELVRIGRQVRLLDQEAAAALSEPATRTVLPVAVSADSLALWFEPVFFDVARWSGIALQVYVEDQDQSTRLLRAGSVMAAITSDPAAVQGCSVQALGSMRYLPVATPELVAEHRKGRSVDWERLPVIRFNEDDDLQAQVLRARGVAGHGAVVTHRVPSTESFAAAVSAGLGWGALPEAQLGDALADGSLVRLPGTAPVDVPLYWQRWRIESAYLDRLTAFVTDAARQLRPSEGTSRRRSRDHHRNY